MLTESRAQPLLHRYSIRHTFPSREDAASLNLSLSRRTWHERETETTVRPGGGGPGPPRTTRRTAPPHLAPPWPHRTVPLAVASPRPEMPLFSVPKEVAVGTAMLGVAFATGLLAGKRRALSSLRAAATNGLPEPEPRPAAQLERSEPKSSPKRPATGPAAQAGQELLVLRCSGGRQLLVGSGGSRS